MRVTGDRRTCGHRSVRYAVYTRACATVCVWLIHSQARIHRPWGLCALDHSGVNTARDSIGKTLWLEALAQPGRRKGHPEAKQRPRTCTPLPVQTQWSLRFSFLLLVGRNSSHRRSPCSNRRLRSAPLSHELASPLGGGIHTPKTQLPHCPQLPPLGALYLPHFLRHLEAKAP